MKTVLVIMALTVATHASTYICNMDASKISFTLEEDKPAKNQALLYSNGSNKPVVLKFTETSTTRNTRLGSVVTVKKVYFHPYYEYQIFDTYYTFETRRNSDIKYGSYISEMNDPLPITCRVVN